MEVAAQLSATDLHVDVFSDESELDQLAGRWEAFAGDVPFRGFQWLLTWWRHYGDARSKLLVLVARSPEGEVVGIAPWYASRTAREGRVIRFLGSGEVCSDYLS